MKIKKKSEAKKFLIPEGIRSGDKIGLIGSRDSNENNQCGYGNS